MCDVEAGVVVAVPGHAEHQFAGGYVQLQVLAHPRQRLVQRRVSSVVAAHGHVRTGAKVWMTLVFAVSKSVKRENKYCYSGSYENTCSKN